MIQERRCNSAVVKGKNCMSVLGICPEEEQAGTPVSVCAATTSPQSLTPDRPHDRNRQRSSRRGWKGAVYRPHPKHNTKYEEANMNSQKHDAHEKNTSLVDQTQKKLHKFLAALHDTKPRGTTPETAEAYMEIDKHGTHARQDAEDSASNASRSVRCGDTNPQQHNPRHKQERSAVRM